MNNLPRQMLHQILAKYGKDICSDARRCENLLNDLCGSYRREINVLVNAIEERIPLDLLAGAGSTPPELLLTRLERRLEDQTGLTAEAARWAVESWALALGVVTNEEIQKIQRKQSNLPATKSGTNQSPVSENKSTNPNVSNINPSNQLQAPEKQMPDQPSKAVAPANRQPSKIPLPSPSINLPSNNQSSIQSTTLNPQLQSSNPVVPRSRFGIFRGCLLLIFLFAIASVVLLFGVPYAIEVMRETQRERNDEPPRFPVR